MKTFYKGIVFGLGFGIGLSIIAMTVLSILNKIDPWENKDDISDTGAVVINDHRLEILESGPVVYGTIQNITEKRIKSVAVEASFFSKENIFIERSVDFFRTMDPGEFDGFRISCYDWDESFPLEELSYKLRISQAYFADQAQPVAGGDATR